MATIPKTVIVSGALLAAAWSSSDAWAQAALKDRVAFYDDKVPDIHIQA